jgi:hypothetical protein
MMNVQRTIIEHSTLNIEHFFYSCVSGLLSGGSGGTIAGRSLAALREASSAAATGVVAGFASSSG